MYLSISTLVVILTALPTHSFSAQLNLTNSSIEVIASARSTSNSTLSKRGDELFQDGGFLGAQRRNAANLFDPNTNPNGYINLGGAENVCSSSTIYPYFRSRVETTH